MENKKYDNDCNCKLIVKASVIEETLVPSVLELIKKNNDLFKNEKVVLMADAHIGSIVPIGFTMTVTNENNWIAPDFVSADIGCGVTSYLLKNTSLSKEELEKIVLLIQQKIPIHRNKQGNCFGTLGGGNHFIEFGENNNDLLISVHSGSRSVGGEIHKKAITLSKKQKNSIRDEKGQKIIEQLKAEGKQELIQESLNDLQCEMPLISVPFLDGEKSGYFDEVKRATQYASDSRLEILNNIMEIIKLVKNSELKITEKIESIHNYIDFSGKNPIIRKGSIAAPSGSKVVIPLNMKDGIILGVSQVTEDINESLPHGAGRVYSRTAAKKNINLNDYIEEMKDVVSVTVNQDTLDEAPGAYKSQKDILGDITPYLKDYRIFKTILNYKGV